MQETSKAFFFLLTFWWMLVTTSECLSKFLKGNGIHVFTSFFFKKLNFIWLVGCPYCVSQKDTQPNWKSHICWVELIRTHQQVLHNSTIDQKNGSTKDSCFFLLISVQSRYIQCVWKFLNSHFCRYESITLETFGDTFLPLENSFEFLVIVFIL